MIEMIVWFITFFITAATVTVMIILFYQYRKRIRRMEKLKKEIDEAKALNEKYPSIDPGKKTMESLQELLEAFREYRKVLEKNKREIEANKVLSDEKRKLDLRDIDQKLHEMDVQEKELLKARDTISGSN